MDPKKYKEFMVYFPHDKQICVVPRNNMLFNDTLLTAESMCIYDAIYDDQLFKCIVIMVSTQEFSPEAVSRIRNMKTKMKLSTLLEKVPRFWTSANRLVLPSLKVSERQILHVLLVSRKVVLLYFLEEKTITRLFTLFLQS